MYLRIVFSWFEFLYLALYPVLSGDINRHFTYPALYAEAAEDNCQEIGYATKGPFFFLDSWRIDSAAAAKNNPAETTSWYRNMSGLFTLVGFKHLNICIIITESNVRAAVMAVRNSSMWLLPGELHDDLVLEIKTGLSHGNLWLIHLKH